MEGGFFLEVSDEVGLEAGLGNGLEFGPEVRWVEEVEGACGVGAHEGGSAASEEEEELDEKEIRVVLLGALEEGESLGLRFGLWFGREEVREESFHFGGVVGA